MSELLFSRFFPPKGGWSWYCYLWQCIKDSPRVVKAMYQRATRGWADCDVWNIDSWFQGVVPDMLRRLADTKHGTPSLFFPKGMLENWEDNGEEILKLSHKKTEEIRQKL